MTILTDHRHPVEILAYQVRSFPGMSAEADLAEIAPDLTPASRDAAFGDLIDGLTLRDTACKACEVEPHEVAGILTAPDVRRTAVRAAGTAFVLAMSSAKVVAAIVARDFEFLDGLDRDLDGALGELRAIQDGHFTAADYPDGDAPDRLEELAEEKVTAALADFAARQRRLLDARLERFVVAAWRFTDGARLRLTGGAR